MDDSGIAVTTPVIKRMDDTPSSKASRRVVASSDVDFGNDDDDDDGANPSEERGKKTARMVMIRMMKILLFCTVSDKLAMEMKIMRVKVCDVMYKYYELKMVSFSF